MVHYWSFTSEFSTENLKKFADEVQTVLGELSFGFIYFHRILISTVRL